MELSYKELADELRLAGKIQMQNWQTAGPPADIYASTVPKSANTVTAAIYEELYKPKAPRR